MVNLYTMNWQINQGIELSLYSSVLTKPFQLRHDNGECCFYHIVNKFRYPLLCKHETKIFLLPMNGQIHWCIGFIDLSLILVRTNVIKVCVNFSCNTQISPSVFQHSFMTKIDFFAKTAGFHT